jgi:hypothetical protein
VEVAANTITPTSTTNPKSLKSRLRNGETLYGLFLLSFSPTFAKIAGLSGYDFVIVDMEHSPGRISDTLSWLHVLAATSTPAIHRLPESSATWVRIRKKKTKTVQFCNKWNRAKTGSIAPVHGFYDRTVGFRFLAYFSKFSVFFKESDRIEHRSPVESAGPVRLFKPWV